MEEVKKLIEKNGKANGSLMCILENLEWDEVQRRLPRYGIGLPLGFISIGESEGWDLWIDPAAEPKS